MAAYDVVLTRSAAKELGRLSHSLKERIARSIDGLRDDPRPRGNRKLEAEEDLYRIRIGDYRVIYSIDDTQRIVDVRAIRHRSDAYR